MCGLACCEGCFYLPPCLIFPTESQERLFRSNWWEAGEGSSEAREGAWRGGEGEDEHQAQLFSQVRGEGGRLDGNITGHI